MTRRNASGGKCPSPSFFTWRTRGAIPADSWPEAAPLRPHMVRVGEMCIVSLIAPAFPHDDRWVGIDPYIEER